jgi:hypothetical protein
MVIDFGELVYDILICIVIFYEITGMTTAATVSVDIPNLTIKPINTI